MKCHSCLDSAQDWSAPVVTNRSFLLPIASLFLSLCLCGWNSVRGQQPAAKPEPAAPSPPGSNLKDLTLEELRRLVLIHNESVQMRVLEHEISRKTLAAERGIFEPAIFGSAEAIDSQRPNNAQQQRSLLTAEFIERNQLYAGGLEFLNPIGGRLRAGLNLRRLDNNLQGTSLFGGTNAIDNEYETFVGLNYVQPLLKNFGLAATMVRIRLAALASDIAFQEYRRQLMLTLARAESGYWDLYLLQEQERLSRESVAVAETILKDNQNRFELGRSAELEVLEAEAGVALRRSRLGDALLKRIEGIKQLTTLFSDAGLVAETGVRASEEPAIQEIPLDAFESFQQAFDLNPDYLTRKKQVQQENVRLAFAKNQRLPQLDLKASFGLNGLGESPGESFDHVEDHRYPVWSIGVEMRIPITGGIRERNELEAARLSKQRALLGLKEIETQIVNGLETALHRVRNQRENVRNYQSVVDFHERLLQSQLERLEVGRIDSRSVLETEEQLFQAKIAVVESLVLYQKALLELQLVSGTTLLVRGLELTKAQLKERTEDLLRSGKWSQAALEKYIRDSERIGTENALPDPLSKRREVETLRRALDAERPPSGGLSPAAQEKALDALRRRMQELEEPPLRSTR